MPLRVRQGLVIGLGVVAAAVMTWLGLWQLQVFTDQGNASVQARAQQSPVPLLEHVASDGTVGDIYGKPVTVTGRYLSQQQRVLGPDGVVRVLSALQLADGRVLPVVRGVIPLGAGSPAPPSSGEVRETGIFLPSEPAAEHALAQGYELGSVRLAQLAQLWPHPLLPGFVTLEATGAQRGGLQPATVSLPSGEGSWRNSGYALQWWVFALFGLGMAIRIASTMGRKPAPS